MSVSLGGSSFVYNGIKQDYSFIETFDCLCELCDQVSIVCGGDDGTIERIRMWEIQRKSLCSVNVIVIQKPEWEAQQGREKLSYFSNIAISQLNTDWNFYLQCDEIIHEDSFNYIRAAIELDEEAFFCHRINLWSSPYTALNVPQERKPVSTAVIRLAKSKYRCIDDAESIGLMPFASPDFHNNIRIYHVGFVRDKHKHLVKIKHIQEDIFLFGEADKRIHDCEDGFDCWKFGFGINDIEPITEKLPKFIQQWASEREVDPFKYTEEGLKLAADFCAKFGHMMASPITKDKIVRRANEIWWVWAKQFQ